MRTVSLPDAQLLVNSLVGWFWFIVCLCGSTFMWKKPGKFWRYLWILHTGFKLHQLFFCHLTGKMAIKQVLLPIIFVWFMMLSLPDVLNNISPGMKNTFFRYSILLTYYRRAYWVRKRVSELRRAVVSYWRKNVHEVLINCLGGLPRNSVDRLTDPTRNDLKNVEGQ